LESKVLKNVESLSDEMVALCQELVRISTVNPYSGDETANSEREGQLRLEPVLREMGAKTRLFDCPADIYKRMGVLGPKGREFADRPNVVAEFEFGTGGKRIVVNGHMDTVGAAGMSFDPFGAEVKDGRILGRGTSDCKGGLTCGLMAIKALLPFASQLNGSIVYESVVDEECSGSGAGTLACCEAGYRGDAAWVVDGNDLLVTYACNGCLTADVAVQGRAAHAASKEGVSAIDKALIVKAAIDGFKQQRESVYPDAKVNLGLMRAGVHPAVVPGEALLSLNIVYEICEAVEAERKGKGWHGVEVREAFEEAIRRHESADEWLAEHSSTVEWVKDLIPFETPTDDPFVQEVMAVGEAALGRPSKLHRIAAWADGAYLSQFGKMPTVLYGPGIGAVCHSPDEYVEISNLVDAAKALALHLWRTLRA